MYDIIIAHCEGVLYRMFYAGFSLLAFRRRDKYLKQKYKQEQS